MGYGILKLMVDGLIRPFVRLEVMNQPELPEDSGALVAVNHIHALDPVFVSYALYPTYWVHHLAKEEIFKVFFLRPALNWVGAIPINRQRPGADSIKRTMEHFEAGEYVCIFPQGTRRKEGFGQIKKGTARLALANQVPICPVAISGLENVRFWGFFKRPTVKIIFGDMISVQGRESTKEEIGALTEELQIEMERLYQQIYPSE